MGNLFDKITDATVTVALDVNHSVTEVMVSTVDATAIFGIDTERNLFQSYMDTQANIAMVLNNYGANVANVVESTQRNIALTAMDTETRFFAVVDSVLDRITDIVMAVADGFIFVAILWIISLGGVYLLYNKEIFALIRSFLDKVPIIPIV
jgi:hypothetical protein